jgi:hypothetical protein
MSFHAGSTPVRQMNPDYEKWNAAICERYFPESGIGRPTYLALDEEELSELAPVVGVSRDDALERFVSSILVESQPPIPVWRPFIQAMATWRYEGASGLPPYVGLLGLCVIAASQMETDKRQGIGGHAYYPRLKALLGREPTTGIPDGFERVRDLWHDLNVWLEEDLQGARGRSTVRSHPRLSNIGWPLSQCILRAADRNRLPDFFRTSGLEAGLSISDERLFALFKAWANRSQLITGQALRLINKADAAIEEELTRMLQRELAAWDGSLRDARGRQRADILVRVKDLLPGRRVALSLVAPQPDGFPEGAFRSTDGRELAVAGGRDGWYGDLELPLTSKLLEKGVSFAKDRWALSFSPAPIIPLRGMFEKDGWVEVRQASFIDKHMLLVQAAHVEAVETFLNRHASAGWRSLQPKGNLPSGWRLFDHVSIHSAPVDFDPALSRLIPRLNVGSRLEGGLLVAKGIYLSSGEPDLWVHLDGTSDASVKLPTGELTLKPGIQRVRLSEQPLPAGTIAVDAAGITRHFEIIETFREVLPKPSRPLVHVVEGNNRKPLSNSAVPLDTTTISENRYLVAGASISTRSPETLEFRAPLVMSAGWHQYFFFGRRPGEFACQGRQHPPAWLERLPNWTFQFVEFTLDFEAHLAVVRGAREPGTQETLLLVKAASPEPSSALADERATDNDNVWAENILGIAEESPEVPDHLTEIWSSYVKAAADIREHASDSG